MFSAKSIEIPKNSQPPNSGIGIGEIDFGSPSSYLASMKSANSDSFSLGETKMPQISDISADPILDLKLGKRAAISSSFSVISMASAPPAKRFKFKNQREKAQCCQVEGCNLDLSSAKHYHRKHRVCEMHSKCPKVVVAGLELRFCQQCSRFHGLSEFDAKKRSCRRRLSDHNWRRRKLQPEPVHYLSQARPPSSLQINGAGLQESIISSNLDASQNLHLHRHALSLLSTNSWSSSQQPKPVFLDHHHMHKIHTRIPQPGIPQDLPLPSAEYWQIQQQPNNFQLNNFSSASRSDATSHFQEFQLFGEPYI